MSANTSFNTIYELNIYLSNNLTNLKINDYFKQINQQFYQKLDISFIDYFLELCENENQFIVDHIKLKEYGVIKTFKSNDIQRCLKQFDLIENVDCATLRSQDCLAKANLIENVDYRVLNVQQPVKQEGYSIKKEYTLTPYAFKFK